MHKIASKHSIEINKKEIAIYSIAIALCGTFLIYILKLWNADITIPFVYEGDANFSSVFIKSMIDTGWYTNNPYLGGVNGTNFADFPTSDSFHYLLMKFISLFTSKFGLVVNIYYLLGYFLSTITALYVLRRFEISGGPAIMCSLLFAFMPYHFFRNEAHLLLGAYYMIPLIIMVALWIFNGGLAIIHKKGGNIFKENAKNHYLIEAIIICAIASSSGVYFAFFACFFFGIAVFSQFLKCNKINRTITAGFVMIVIVSVGLMVNILPSFINNIQFGSNDLVGKRYWFESESYALRLTGLILPIIGHRISLFNELAIKYIQSTQIPNPNICAPIGIIGCIGLILLLIYLFVPAIANDQKNKNSNILRDISKLNIAAILLATAGGLGTIFAIVISPQIRAYDRISIFIAYFCLLAVAFGIQYFYDKYKHNKRFKIIIYLVTAFLLFFGIFDQTSPNFIPNYNQVKAEYTSDDEFVRKIENLAEDNALIFQLPYHAYPETGPLYRLNAYDHFKGYLHSQTLRWSYGAMRGRPGDIWQENLALKPANELINKLAFSGYKGIYIDRFGYEDNGTAIESELTNLLRITPIVSQNNRLLFFDISNYTTDLKSKYSQDDWNKLQDTSLHPLEISWKGGFSGLEGNGDKNWRWCGPEGQLQVNNTSNYERKVLVTLNFTTGYAEYSNLTIKAGDFREQLKVNGQGIPFSKELIIPTGRYTISFSCDAKRVDAAGDPRVLVFSVNDFSLNELN